MASKEHLHKTLMKLGQVGVTLTAKKSDLSQNLRFITILSKAGIRVLDIMGGQNHPLRDFKKIMIIPTVGAGNEMPSFLAQPLRVRYCFRDKIHFISSFKILTFNLKQRLYIVNIR